MKNFLNTISEEEKNRILEMHSSIKNIITESDDDEDDEPRTKRKVAEKWDDIADTRFFTTFIRRYPNEKKLKDKYEGKDMMEGLEKEFARFFPGEDYLHDFFKDLRKVDW
jgi:hypothetical protein